jgi:hypothetical protein
MFEHPFLVLDFLTSTQSLHSIERANINDKKCVMRILRATYGRTGKVRHFMLMVSSFICVALLNAFNCLTSP